jgi:hypothetical protein
MFFAMRDQELSVRCVTPIPLSLSSLSLPSSSHEDLMGSHSLSLEKKQRPRCEKLQVDCGGRGPVLKATRSS